MCVVLTTVQLQEMLRKAEVIYGENDERTVKIRNTLAERQLGHPLDNINSAVHEMLGFYKATSAVEPVRELDPRPKMNKWAGP